MVFKISCCVKKIFNLININMELWGTCSWNTQMLAKICWEMHLKDLNKGPFDQHLKDIRDSLRNANGRPCWQCLQNGWDNSGNSLLKVEILGPAPQGPFLRTCLNGKFSSLHWKLLREEQEGGIPGPPPTSLGGGMGYQSLPSTNLCKDTKIWTQYTI